MSYCFNPSCTKPKNPDHSNFCFTCGSQLLLNDRYRATDPIGQGGFGKTFKAVDQYRRNHPCVIKVFLLPPEQNQKATELFNQEAVRLYELGRHDQIPELYAHFTQDNRSYLVQEFIDGQNLWDELKQQGRKSESQIREILADVLPLLKFIHEKGVIHRDIKPENIMRRCNDDKLVLIDFGVSKQVAGTLLSRVGTIVGTPGYASIEQMRGQAYPASDLYSLGVTCVGLLTGCLPTEAGSHELYDVLEGRWLWRGRLQPGTTVSSELGEILDKLLKDFVKERYQLATEVLQALNQPKIAKKITNYNPFSNIFPVYNFPSPPTSVVLESSRGIDYTKLQNLLAAKNWEEADRETSSKMIKVVGQQQREYLTTEDIKKIPSKDLRTINELWTQYSKSRFGFSVQNQIWIEEGKMLDAWANRIGWRVNNQKKDYRQMVFTENAPSGHLPWAVWRYVRRMDVDNFLTRVEAL